MGNKVTGSGGSLISNLKNLPRLFKGSLIRHGAIKSDRTRSQAVFSNLFLHIHAARSNIRSLRFSTTLAMGIASLSLFLILTATGIMLMVYYKPSVGSAYDSIKDIHLWSRPDAGCAIFTGGAHT